MNDDLEGWKQEATHITPLRHWRFDYWIKNISTELSGILFRVTRLQGKEIDQYSLSIVGIPVCLATRPTLEECQVLAHETARLWAGEKT